MTYSYFSLVVIFTRLSALKLAAVKFARDEFCKVEHHDHLKRVLSNSSCVAFFATAILDLGGSTCDPSAGASWNHRRHWRFFTGLLAFVVLGVAVAPKTKSSQIFGLAIGKAAVLADIWMRHWESACRSFFQLWSLWLLWYFSHLFSSCANQFVNLTWHRQAQLDRGFCIVVGGLSVGNVSGAFMNPAVSVASWAWGPQSLHTSRENTLMLEASRGFVVCIALLGFQVGVAVSGAGSEPKEVAVHGESALNQVESIQSWTQHLQTQNLFRLSKVGGYPKIFHLTVGRRRRCWRVRLEYHQDSPSLLHIPAVWWQLPQCGYSFDDWNWWNIYIYIVIYNISK